MNNIFKPLLIFIVAFFIFNNNLLSQEIENPIFKIDSITGNIELNKYWKYHAGDDALWSSFDYNDSDWDTTLQTSINLISNLEDKFTGFGWFRLHLQIDSSLRNKTFALNIVQQGALEIYLNGELINSVGVLGLTEDIEEITNPKALPYLISFNSSTNYILAIRYSNLHAYYNLKKYREADAGFHISILPHETAIQRLKGTIQGTYLILAIFMILLVLSLIHFLLFLFYRKQKSNLYYSIFMILFSGLIFSIFLRNNVYGNPLFVHQVSFIISLIFPLLFIPLTGLIYNLFSDKIPKIFWITILIAIVLSLMYYLNIKTVSYFYIGFVLFLWFEVTRVVIRAMIKKFDGAWIIGIGVLFFILLFSIIMLNIIRHGSITFGSMSVSNFIFGMFTIAAILSIPISMSVYLARDFARTNIKLEEQLEQVKILSAKTLKQEREKQRILENQKEKLEAMVEERTKELAKEKEITEELLLNTLPLKVVNELKENGKSEPESFENVTVYFSDIVGFTNISSQLDPHTLISELSDMFTVFDDIMTKYQCERIKTIGDAYLAVSGMPLKNEHHAENMINAATEIKNYLEERNKATDVKWRIRIGIHSGKVVGGIVGIRKYIYDVFGDTINTASRMESNSEAMRINVSETSFNILKDKFSFIERDAIEVKGKGKMKMYFLDE